MTYIVPMKKIALVGTVSNAGKKLENDLLKVVRACEGLELVKILLVESDSSDNTVAILEKLQSCNRNFSFVTLGKLSDGFPDRIDRIRHCRNVYVQEIREFISESKIDYVIIADLDGMQSGINVNGIQSSFIRDDWAAVLANQGGGYYDLLALNLENYRHRLKLIRSKLLIYLEFFAEGLT
jgi:glycosyltransferase involved in cell wall biosynthesis